VREKQHRKAFTEHEALHANKLLGLVHINVWGLAKTPSFGGERYFVSFIADFFGKSFIYILKSKKECFSKFKDFQAVIENQTQEKIKILRRDNRGEFTSNEFQEFLKLHRIHHSTSMLYLPQQNGVVDLLHHTIVEVVHYMVHHPNLDASYWAEVGTTIINLKARSPHKESGGHQKQFRSGRKLAMKHMQVCGCDAHAHRLS
jgi:transposase InsO family protein